MIDRIPPSHKPMPTGSTGNKVKESGPVETHSEDKEAAPYIVDQPDRRKNRDRRDRGEDSRSLYELRSGRDRRKGHGGNPTIEIKV